MRHVYAPNAQYGNNALLRAVIYGHANCVKALVEGGAHKEARNKVRKFDSCVNDLNV
jgi:hypothetical protein